jgi:hypothetical protein
MPRRRHCLPQLRPEIGVRDRDEGLGPLPQGQTEQIDGAVLCDDPMQSASISGVGVAAAPWTNTRIPLLTCDTATSAEAASEVQEFIQPVYLCAPPIAGGLPTRAPGFTGSVAPAMENTWSRCRPAPGPRGRVSRIRAGAGHASQ